MRNVLLLNWNFVIVFLWEKLSESEDFDSSEFVTNQNILHTKKSDGTKQSDEKTLSSKFTANESLQFVTIYKLTSWDSVVLKI